MTDSTHVKELSSLQKLRGMKSSNEETIAPTNDISYELKPLDTRSMTCAEYDTRLDINLAVFRIIKTQPGEPINS